MGINGKTFNKFCRRREKMYRNLVAEMARNQVDRYAIAKAIGKSYNQTREKINGKSPFTYDEALTIQEAYFPDVDLKYLFER
jgi:hypothetical protein